jgi:hypothetical protein
MDSRSMTSRKLREVIVKLTTKGRGKPLSRAMTQTTNKHRLPALLLRVVT